MRWPWVSRTTMDAEVSRLRTELSFAKQWEQIARDDYRDLLDKYHALKVNGAVAPMQAQSREIDPVSQAIIAKARGNPALYAHYASYVATQRAQRIPEDSIAQSILGGVDDDLGVPL